MIKQSLQKIDKLIRERQYSLPEIMLKLEAFLMHFSRKIVSQGEDYAASDLYAQAVKFFRNYLVQQPYKLTKINTPAIAQAIQNDSMQHLEQLFALRNRFLKELAVFTPSDPFGKKIVSELNDLKWVKKLVKELVPAQQVRRVTQLKKGSKSCFSELTVLLWYGEFKGEYLVHVNAFLERCITFFKEYFSVAQFIDANSFPYLQQLCDHEKKYYLTIHQCDDFFQRLRSPEVIGKLWQLTQQKSKFLSFQSQSSIVMHLTNKDQSVDQIIGVTGQKLILAQGVEKDVKLPPVVLVGSAGDCDFVLKSKYISRKQMLIIEEKKSIKHPQHERYNYYIVCLSLTNFTLLQYPYRVKACVGMIFYAESTKYQIVGCEKEEVLGQTQQEQDQRTLTLLPSQNSIKASENNHKLALLILSGEDKEKQFSLRGSTFKKQTELDSKHEVTLKDHLQHDQGFYIRPNVKILAKSSNDILQGRTSRKLRLCKGMRVILDEYVLSID